MAESPIDGLRFVIRTPQRAVFDGLVRAVRVPTETGQVGLRARGEPLVLVVESGLIILHLAEETHFAATAGGLLESGRSRCVLYTPFAVVDETESRVLAGLDHALAVPNSELVARRKLGELEQHILHELRERGQSTRSRRG